MEKLRPQSAGARTGAGVLYAPCGFGRASVRPRRSRAISRKAIMSIVRLDKGRA